MPVALARQQEKYIQSNKLREEAHQENDDNHTSRTQILEPLTQST